MNLFKKILLLLVCCACFQTARAGWTKQNSGTLAWFHSVYFLDETHGWIAGSQGTLLTTGDGGKTWTQKGNKFTGDTIRDVYFKDAANGWLLCERDIYSLGANSPSYLMRTTNGGASWEKIELVGERERIARIFFDRKGYGFAVGEAGTFYAMQDDRKTWKKNSLPVRYLMTSGNFTDELHGALVGAGGTILFTEDAGITWNQAAVLNKPDAKFRAVYFSNLRSGWAVGAQGKIFTTVSGGRNWRAQNSNVTEDLTDVFFVNSSEGWAVGDDGVTLHTTNAGNFWLPIETGIKHKLEKVFFVSRDKGFAVGFGGTILTFDSKPSETPLKVKPQMQMRNY